MGSYGSLPRSGGVGLCRPCHNNCSQVTIITITIFTITTTFIIIILFTIVIILNITSVMDPVRPTALSVPTVSFSCPISRNVFQQVSLGSRDTFLSAAHVTSVEISEGGCPAGLHLDVTSRSCQSCPQPCSSCSSTTLPAVPPSSSPPTPPSSCAACPPPLLLHDGACLPSCPARTFPFKVLSNLSDTISLHGNDQDEASGLVCKSCHWSCESCVGPLDTQCGKCIEGSFYFERRSSQAISIYQCDLSNEKFLMKLFAGVSLTVLQDTSVTQL